MTFGFDACYKFRCKSRFPGLNMNFLHQILQQVKMEVYDSIINVQGLLIGHEQLFFIGIPEFLDAYRPKVF